MNLPHEDDNISKEYGTMNLESRWQDHLSSAQFALKQLGSALSYLPRVDSQGRSECPFAEDLYRQKEKKHRSAERELHFLDTCLSTISIELGRCRRNMELLSKATKELETPWSRHGASVALERAIRRYKLVQRQQREFRRVYDALAAVLEESRGKTFPVQKTDDVPPRGPRNQDKNDRKDKGDRKDQPAFQPAPAVPRRMPPAGPRRGPGL